MGKRARFFNFPYQSKVKWNFSWKSVNKKFWPILRTFLTNRGKNKDGDEKIWKNELIFEFSISKSRLYGTFHENLRKKFFSKFLPEKDILGQRCPKGWSILVEKISQAKIWETKLMWCFTDISQRKYMLWKDYVTKLAIKEKSFVRVSVCRLSHYLCIHQ